MSVGSGVNPISSGVSGAQPPAVERSAFPERAAPLDRSYSAVEEDSLFVEEGERAAECIRGACYCLVRPFLGCMLFFGRILARLCIFIVFGPQRTAEDEYIALANEYIALANRPGAQSAPTRQEFVRAWNRLSDETKELVRRYVYGPFHGESRGLNMDEYVRINPHHAQCRADIVRRIERIRGGERKGPPLTWEECEARALPEFYDENPTHHVIIEALEAAKNARAGARPPARNQSQSV